MELIDLLNNEGADFNSADVHLARPLHYAAQMCGGQGETADPKLGLKLLNKLISLNIDIDAQDQVNKFIRMLPFPMISEVIIVKSGEKLRFDSRL